MALRSTKQSFKVRHTLKVEGRVAEARRVLGLTFAHMDEFETMAKALFETEMNAKQWSDLVKSIYPLDDNAPKGTATKHQQKMDVLDELYFKAPTQDGIRGTAWGALNAMTERLDYYRPSRTANGEAIVAAASGFDAMVNAEKARILSAVREFASA